MWNRWICIANLKFKPKVAEWWKCSQKEKKEKKSKEIKWGKHAILRKSIYQWGSGYLKIIKRFGLIL